MKRCGKCNKGALEPARVEFQRRVEDRTFRGEIAAHRCSHCGEISFDGPVLERFDLLVALELARSGEQSGTSIRFTRKALGLMAKELAELFATSAETVSRWERGKLPVDYKARALLASMVVDALKGHGATMEALRMLQHPLPAAKEVILPPVEAAIRTGA